MQKTLNINYTNLNNGPLTEDILLDEVALENMANNIETCVRTGLEGSVAEGEDPYQCVLVDGTSVSTVIGNKYKDREQTPEERNRLCALYIAQAQMKNKIVETKIAANNYQPTPLLCSGEIPSPVERDTLSLWDKILLFFGFGQDRLTDLAQNEADIKTGRDRVYGAMTSNINNTIEDRHNFRKKHNEYADYKNNVSTDYKRINDMYVKNLDKEIEASPALAPLASSETPNISNMMSKHNYNSRSNDNILTCMMLIKGHSLKDIADVNFTTDREAVGKEMLQMINEISSLNRDTSHKAQEKLANVYVEGAKKFLQQDMSSANDCKDFLKSKTPVYDYMVQRMGHDLSQEFHRGSNLTEFILTNPQNKVLADKVSAASYLGNQYTVGKVHASSWDNYDTALDNNSVLICESLRNFTNDFTDYSGKTIGDFVTNNQGANEANIFGFRSLVCDFADKFNPNAENPLAPKDLFDNKLNVYEMHKDDESFIASKSEAVMQHEMSGGRFDIREAKANLAMATADVFLFDKKDQIPLTEKCKVATKIMNTEPFIASVHNKSVDEVNRLINNGGYMDKVVKAFAPTKEQAAKVLKENVRKLDGPKSEASM